jgi:hypothetical protein
VQPDERLALVAERLAAAPRLVAVEG